MRRVAFLALILLTAACGSKRDVPKQVEGVFVDSVSFGRDVDGQMTIKGSVTNSSVNTVSCAVEFELFDKEGYPFGTSRQMLQGVGPNATQSFAIPVSPSALGFRLKGCFDK